MALDDGFHTAQSYDRLFRLLRRLQAWEQLETLTDDFLESSFEPTSASLAAIIAGYVHNHDFSMAQSTLLFVFGELVDGFFSLPSPFSQTCFISERLFNRSATELPGAAVQQIVSLTLLELLNFIKANNADVNGWSIAFLGLFFHRRLLIRLISSLSGRGKALVVPSAGSDGVHGPAAGPQPLD